VDILEKIGLDKAELVGTLGVLNMTTDEPPETEATVYYWLAEVNKYGVADELCDGPHSDIQGVEKAMYLYEQFGLVGDSKFCCVRVEQMAVEAKQHDVRSQARR
jgi:hypothetical protein